MNMLKLAKYAKCVNSLTFKTPEYGIRFIQVTAVYKGNTVDEANVSLTQNGQSHILPKYVHESMGTQDWGTWASVRTLHTIQTTINEDGKVFAASRTISKSTTEDDDDGHFEIMNSRED